MRSAIGKRIRELREERGLTQRALAGPGVTNAYISRIEKGQREPSLRVLLHVAAKLNTTALFLMTGVDEARCPVCGRAA